MQRSTASLQHGASPAGRRAERLDFPRRECKPGLTTIPIDRSRLHPYEDGVAASPKRVCVSFPSAIPSSRCVTSLPDGEAMCARQGRRSLSRRTARNRAITPIKSESSPGPVTLVHRKASLGRRLRPRRPSIRRMPRLCLRSGAHEQPRRTPSPLSIRHLDRQVPGATRRSWLASRRSRRTAQLPILPCASDSRHP